MNRKSYLRPAEKACFFCGIHGGGTKRHRFHIYGCEKPLYVCSSCVESRGGSPTVHEELKKMLTLKGRAKRFGKNLAKFSGVI